MGRAHTIFPTTNVSSDTGSTSGAGRGGKLHNNFAMLFFTNYPCISINCSILIFSFFFLTNSAKLSSDNSAKGAADLVGRPDNKRGALRLRRDNNEILRTRPSTNDSKVGTSGTPVTLQANYFKLTRRPEWQIFRYRVDFKPEVLHEKFRKALIYKQKEKLGGYLFDGTQLFLTRKLDSDLVEMPATGRNEDETYLLVIKFTGEVSMSESTSLQILK